MSPYLIFLLSILSFVCFFISQVYLFEKKLNAYVNLKNVPDYLFSNKGLKFLACIVEEADKIASYHREVHKTGYGKGVG